MKRCVLVALLVLAALVAVPGQSASAACRPALKSLGLSKSSVVGGGSVTATVTLTCRTAKAVTVRLKAFPGVSLPASVRVARNRSSARVTVRTSVTFTVRRGDVVATLGRLRRTARLTVNPRACRPVLTGVAMPALVYAGDRVTGRISLSCAPNTDVRVTLRSDRPSLTVPTSVIVRRGRSTAAVPVTAALVSGSRYRARVTAAQGGRALGRDITVNPGLKSVDIPPSSDPNGVSVHPFFTGPAPTGGLTVKVASDNPAVTVPPTHTFPAGAYGGDVWNIRVHPVTKNTKVTISVTLGTRTLRASKILLPPFDGTQRVHLIADDALPLYGLQYDRDFHVLLSNPAPENGLVAQLRVRGDDPAVQLDDADDHISGGATTGHFRLRTADVTKTTRVELIATVGGVSTSLVVTIHPRITGVVVPETAKSGAPFPITITLAGPSDVDSHVYLHPGWGILHPPEMVTIPAGETSVTFEATSSPVDEPSAVFLTASLGSTSFQSSYVTLTP
ncbi:hypothetical protein [Thermomonospora umbrina]|uniref:Ig-like domain-containing protein n=1 Tax=Thermomonospora umbrina TaxID=111806 RepID=A0A3D9SLW4_9ACTN|nr:hypothetical protein [Thermomonospora umbrina]REE96717.1 hypothetical protein DFJ69_2164 [Thermomonospora umbrina]